MDISDSLSTNDTELKETMGSILSSSQENEAQNTENDPQVNISTEEPTLTSQNIEVSELENENLPDSAGDNQFTETLCEKEINFIMGKPSTSNNSEVLISEKNTLLEVPSTSNFEEHEELWLGDNTRHLVKVDTDEDFEVIVKSLETAIVETERYDIDTEITSKEEAVASDNSIEMSVVEASSDSLLADISSDLLASTIPAQEEIPEFSFESEGQAGILDSPVEIPIQHGILDNYDEFAAISEPKIESFDDQSSLFEVMEQEIDIPVENEPSLLELQEATMPADISGEFQQNKGEVCEISNDAELVKKPDEEQADDIDESLEKENIEQLTMSADIPGDFQQNENVEDEICESINDLKPVEKLDEELTDDIDESLRKENIEQLTQEVTMSADIKDFQQNKNEEEPCKTSNDPKSVEKPEKEQRDNISNIDASIKKENIEKRNESSDETNKQSTLFEYDFDAKSSEEVPTLTQLEIKSDVKNVDENNLLIPEIPLENTSKVEESLIESKLTANVEVFTGLSEELQDSSKEIVEIQTSIIYEKKESTQSTENEKFPESDSVLEEQFRTYEIKQSTIENNDKQTLVIREEKKSTKSKVFPESDFVLEEQGNKYETEKIKKECKNTVLEPNINKSVEESDNSNLQNKSEAAKISETALKNIFDVKLAEIQKESLPPKQTDTNKFPSKETQHETIASSSTATETQQETIASSSTPLATQQEIIASSSTSIETKQETIASSSTSIETKQETIASSSTSIETQQETIASSSTSVKHSLESDKKDQSPPKKIKLVREKIQIKPELPKSHPLQKSITSDPGKSIIQTASTETKKEVITPENTIKINPKTTQVQEQKSVVSFGEKETIEQILEKLEDLNDKSEQKSPSKPQKFKLQRNYKLPQKSNKEVIAKKIDDKASTSTEKKIVEEIKPLVKSVQKQVIAKKVDVISTFTEKNVKKDIEKIEITDIPGDKSDTIKILDPVLPETLKNILTTESKVSAVTEILETESKDEIIPVELVSDVEMKSVETVSAIDIFETSDKSMTTENINNETVQETSLAIEQNIPEFTAKNTIETNLPVDKIVDNEIDLVEVQEKNTKDVEDCIEEVKTENKEVESQIDQESALCEDLNKKETKEPNVSEILIDRTAAQEEQITNIKNESTESKNQEVNKVASKTEENKESCIIENENLDDQNIAQKDLTKTEIFQNITEDLSAKETTEETLADTNIAVEEQIVTDTDNSENITSIAASNSSETIEMVDETVETQLNIVKIKEAEEENKPSVCSNVDSIVEKNTEVEMTVTETENIIETNKTNEKIEDNVYLEKTEQKIDEEEICDVKPSEEKIEINIDSVQFEEKTETENVIDTKQSVEKVESGDVIDLKELKEISVTENIIDTIQLEDSTVTIKIVDTNQLEENTETADVIDTTQIEEDPEIRDVINIKQLEEKNETENIVDTQQLDSKTEIDDVNNQLKDKTQTENITEVKMLEEKTETEVVLDVKQLEAETETDHIINTKQLLEKSETVNVDTKQLEDKTEAVKMDIIQLEEKGKPENVIDINQLEENIEAVNIDTIHLEEETETANISTIQLEEKTEAANIDIIQLEEKTDIGKIFDTKQLKEKAKTANIINITQSEQKTETPRIDITQTEVKPETQNILLDNPWKKINKTKSQKNKDEVDKIKPALKTENILTMNTKFPLLSSRLQERLEPKTRKFADDVKITPVLFPTISQEAVSKKLQEQLIENMRNTKQDLFPGANLELRKTEPSTLLPQSSEISLTKEVADHSARMEGTSRRKVSKRKLDTSESTAKRSVTKPLSVQIDDLETHSSGTTGQREQENIPKIVIKPIPKPEGRSSPKITIKPIKPPEETIKSRSTEESSHSPKITIKPIIKPDPLKITITKQKSDDTHSILKIYQPGDNQTQLPDHIPKLTIKPIPKSDEMQHSPRITIKPVKPSTSSMSPKITVKPISSPSEQVEIMHSPKITVKPIVNPEESYPKVTIKPVLRPEETHKVSQLSPRQMKMKNMTFQSSSGVTVEPICGTGMSQKSDADSHSAMKISVKSFAKMEEAPSPKLTIKPITKTCEIVQSEDGLANPLKLTIKPILKPEESSYQSPKITIKPIVKPDEMNQQQSEEIDKPERIILKIQKNSLPSPKERMKDSRKEPEVKIEAISNDPEKNQKLDKIKLKLTKEGSHAQIISSTDGSFSLKRSLGISDSNVVEKRSRSEFSGTEILHTSDISINIVQPNAKPSPKTISEEVTIMKIDKVASSSSRVPTAQQQISQARFKEMLMKIQQKPDITCTPQHIEEPDYSSSSDDVKIVEIIDNDPLKDPLSINDESNSQDIMIVNEVINTNPFQNIQILDSPVADTNLQTPKKRGRPRKNPLEVKPEIKGEDCVEVVRPKRTCRAPPGRTPFAVKERKPRGAGRGRGGSRGRGASKSPQKSPKEVKSPRGKALKEAKALAKIEAARLAQEIVIDEITIEDSTNDTPAATPIPPAEDSPQKIEVKESEEPQMVEPEEKIIEITEELPTQPQIGEELPKQPEISEELLKQPPISEELPKQPPPPAVYEEETRMSADNSSRAQTPAPPIFTAPLVEGPEESQSSVLSTATTESTKTKKGRLEVCDPDSAVTTVDQIVEYSWANGGPYMLQEQIAQYLGVKSFKRKYPGLTRRPVEMQERDYIREKGLVSESMCDMGLTAVPSSEILDIMYSDFQEKYEEYRKCLRDKQAKEISNKQKAVSLATSQEKNKIDFKERAIRSAASWNLNFNKARKDGRKCCMDLQTFTINYPAGKIKVPHKTPVGHYPVALVPGQYTDFYKSYTANDLNYLPLNTVRYGPVIPNQRCEPSQSDGSQSDSDSSSGSDSDSSDDSMSTEDDAPTPIICKPATVQLTQLPTTPKSKVH